MASGKINRVLAANARVIGKAIRDGAPNRIEYRITGVPGLRLRVSESGGAQWCVRYSVRENGKRVSRRYMLGDASERNIGTAIDEANRIMVAVKQEKKDPTAELREVQQAEITDVEPTFGGVFHRFLEGWSKPNLRSWRNDEQLYRTHIEHEWADTPVTQVSRRDLIALRDKVAVKRKVKGVARGIGGPRASNHMVTLVNRVMNWAVDEDIIEFNKCGRIRKVGAQNVSSRILPDADLVTFWNAQAKDPRDVASKRILKLLLLTGQRRNEVTEVLVLNYILMLQIHTG